MYIRMYKEVLSWI